MADYCFRCGSILTTSPTQRAFGVMDTGDAEVTFYYKCPLCGSEIPVERAFNVFDVAKVMY